MDVVRYPKAGEPRNALLKGGPVRKQGEWDAGMLELEMFRVHGLVRFTVHGSAVQRLKKRRTEVMA